MVSSWRETMAIEGDKTTILDSKIEWYFLKELAKHAYQISDVLCLDIKPTGVGYRIRNFSDIIQVDMFLGKRMFKKYKAVEGRIGLHAEEFYDILRRMGPSDDILRFRVTTDSACIIRNRKKFDIPLLPIKQVIDEMSIGWHAKSQFPFTYFTAVSNCIFGDNDGYDRIWTDMEICMSEKGPVKITRHTPHFLLSYTLAPVERKPEC
jgi:hypothetical protein